MQTGASPSILSGIGGLPKIRLTTPAGASAEIYLHGAHITSWVPAGGAERLFLSRTSEFGPDASIRGGIPVVFPQFANRGPLPKHGFIRRLEWELLPPQSTTSQALLQLKDTPATRALWPYPFLCQLKVTLTDQSLDVGFTVVNSGSASFDFTAALHTYFKVNDINSARVSGLHGLNYIDTAHDTEAPAHQADELISFTEEVDRIYLNAPAHLELIDGSRCLGVKSHGFKDTVVWNPWIEKGTAFRDLEPDGYRRFVCIESAAVGTPITLAPTQSWSGVQKLIA